MEKKGDIMLIQSVSCKCTCPEGQREALYTVLRIFHCTL